MGGDACDACEADWPWICRADRQNSRADDQQAAEHEVGHGHGQLGRGLLGVPTLCARRSSTAIEEMMRGYPPLLGKF